MRCCRPRPSTGSPTTTRCSAHLAGVLRTGGRLVAQCGGAGNIASVMAALAAVGDGWTGPAHFETPEATEARLAAAGFREVRCWLTASR